MSAEGPGLAIKMTRHRPANWRRTAFHINNAVITVLLIEYVLTGTLMVKVAALIAASFWLLEAGRRANPAIRRLSDGIFKSMAHPGERKKVNSATWYATALFLLSLTQSHMLCALAVITLGFGDPMAGVVGRAWGRYKLANNRSLEGTLAFVGAAALAALVVLAIWHPQVGWPESLAIAAGAAAFGAVGELFSAGPIDDNLAIPLTAAAGAWIGAALAGASIWDPSLPIAWLLQALRLLS